MNKVETKIKLVLNNENYDFEIGFDKDKTEIVFSIDEEDKFLSEYYTTKIKLESFLKLSKYFIVCDSIDDIMDCFKNINFELKNENKKYNLDFYIKNDEAILKYNVPIQTGKNISLAFI